MFKALSSIAIMKAACCKNRVLLFISSLHGSISILNPKRTLASGHRLKRPVEKGEVGEKKKREFACDALNDAREFLTQCQTGGEKPV